MSIQTFQIGDLVRVRESVELVPIEEDRPPMEIPGGIYGQILGVEDGLDGPVCYAEFHPPYDYLNNYPIPAELLEVVFRLSF